MSILLSLALVGQAGAGAQRIKPEYFGNGNARCSRRLLISQGFSGVLDATSSMKFRGRIVSSNAAFLVYYYYWTNRETMHGHHRVVILKSDCEYVGSYIFEGVPFHAAGASIKFSVPSEFGNVIRFRNGAPPREAWIDGQNPRLIR